MSGPCILFVTRDLAARGGVQLHLRDVATALLARGARPVVHATRLGEVAQEIRAAGVPVVASLDELGAAPDLVQGQYHPETMAALLRFPAAPGVFVCHAWGSWWEGPPRHPRIARYVAVDHAVRDRLVMEHGIPETRVAVLLNAVDLHRFRPRPPLPEKPQRALVLSNYADERCVEEVRRACAPFGIAVEARGAALGRPTRAPERDLVDCDLVFAKGRTALEALAVGAAVVVCDRAGHGPLVTAAEWPRLRPLNLGFRALRGPLTAETLRGEIARYDAADAAEVTRRARAEADLERAADTWMQLHAEVLAQAASAVRDPQAERRALAEYLAWCARGATRELGRLDAELARVRVERERAKRQRDAAVAALAERSGWRGLAPVRLLRRLAAR